MTPVRCAVGPPITGQLTLEGIPVLGLVDTGASVTCMGFSVWWRYHAQWGPLKPFGGVVHGAHGKPLQMAEKMQHLDLLARLLHSHYWIRITALLDWDGHHAAASRTY